MRLLFLTAYYKPETTAAGILFDDMLTDIANQGHRVVVLTPSPSRSVTGNRTKYPVIERENQGRITIVRIPLYGDTRNVIGRVFRYVILEFLFTVVSLFTRADVIMGSSTPPFHGLVMGLIGKAKGIPVVYNIQDLFPESLQASKIADTTSLKYRIGTLVQQATYRLVPSIITISETLRERISAAGYQGDLHVVENWVDTSHVHAIPREENHLYDEFHIPRDKFIVAYSGNIGHTQNIELIVALCQQLQVRDDIHFVFVGDGSRREELVAKTTGFSNVTFVPFQDPELLAHVFSLGSAGLVISKPGVGAACVPSKTWGLMAAGVPVVSSFDLGTSLTKILDQSHAGVCVPPDDLDALATAITTLADNPATRDAMGKAGRTYVVDHLDRHAQTGKYLQVLLDLVAKHKTTRP